MVRSPCLVAGWLVHAWGGVALVAAGVKCVAIMATRQTTTDGNIPAAAIGLAKAIGPASAIAISAVLSTLGASSA